MTTIYILTNIINDKQYVGKTTVGIDRRLSEHLAGYHQSIIHKAITKYGIENFYIECLEVSDHIANLWEKHLIKRWGTKVPCGYNITDGGDGVSPGTILSIEHRKKISNSLTGKIRTKTHRKKYSKAKMGKRNPSYGKFSKDSPVSKVCILTLPNGEEEHFNSLAEAARKYKLTYKQLSSVACGTHITHKGYRCKYVD